MKKLPRLYPINTTDFSNNGFGSISDAQSISVTEKLTASGSLEMEIYYPITGKVYKEFSLNRIIYSPINPYDNWQPFRIYAINRVSNGIIRINAEHIFYELNGFPCLPNDNYIETAGTASTLMAYLQSEAARTSTALSTNTYTFSTNITKSVRWTIEDITDIKTAMSYAAEVFGGEWKIDGTQCTLLAARGTDRGVRVQYGSNLQSLEQNEVDTSFTHIMPYWTDGTTTVYISGHYIACSNIAETSRKRVLVVNLTPSIDSEPTAAELETAARAWLAENPPTGMEKNQKIKFIPRGQTIEYAAFGDVDHVELGDTVSTADNPLNISVSQRVITTKYNPYKDIYDDVELGATKPSIVSANAKAESGKRATTVWVSIAEPAENYQSGDYWIKIDNEVTRNAQALGRYTGGKWLLLCEFPEGGTGGVGEFTDELHLNERFNDYSGNIISSGNWHHNEGHSNVISGGDANHVEGYNNKAVNTCNYVHIQGSDNVADGCSNVDIGGAYNTMTNGFCFTTIVRGERNVIQGASRSAVFGAGNMAISCDKYLICGERNTAQYGNSSILGGYNNTLTSSDYSLVCGSDNQGTAYASAVFGVGNRFSNVNYALIFGVYGTADSSKRLVIGGGQSSARANIFEVTTSGAVYAAGGYNAIGADYAEYFEWSDGNPDSEDRRGLLVSLDGDKISLANGDDILGIVSAAPSVTGNSAALGWHGKYKTDVFGVPIRDEEGKPILSDDYDRDVKYIPRSQRPEWAAIGLVGRLIVCDNGHCQVGKPIIAKNGLAIPALQVVGENLPKIKNVRVLRRVDDTHIEALIR